MAVFASGWLYLSEDWLFPLAYVESVLANETSPLVNEASPLADKASLLKTEASPLTNEASPLTNEASHAALPVGPFICHYFVHFFLWVFLSNKGD